MNATIGLKNDFYNKMKIQCKCRVLGKRLVMISGVKPTL